MSRFKLLFVLIRVLSSILHSLVWLSLRFGDGDMVGIMRSRLLLMRLNDRALLSRNRRVTVMIVMILFRLRLVRLVRRSSLVIIFSLIVELVLFISIGFRDKMNRRLLLSDIGDFLVRFLILMILLMFKLL